MLNPLKIKERESPESLLARSVPNRAEAAAGTAIAAAVDIATDSSRRNWTPDETVDRDKLVKEMPVADSWDKDMVG